MNVYERLVSLQMTWRDVIDIIVVAVIIYNILALLRGTRAMQVSVGLFVLVASFFVARAFDLPALEAISRQTFFYLPFAIIVLFQHEIRRALARMGGNPLFALFRPSRAMVALGAIVDAADALSAKKIGALMAIERTQSLRSYAEGAKQLDAVLTSDLLVTIFTPGGPLHDGAAILRGDRIVAAGAFLPLTTSDSSTLAHGTRHRAALGLTEESDAVVVVVSEENGSIGVATEGVLREHFDRQSLLSVLREQLGKEARAS
jgi:diadenylate cyclase